ncbi:hypothetical protein AAMO2058_000899200 [Amorphochlora amoebiformis]
MVTHYQILGVKETANAREIRKAYRVLALRWHPDKVQNDQKKEAEDKFKLISEAYQLLSDPKRRKEYDLSLCSPPYFSSRRSSSHPFHFRRARDVFEEFFREFESEFENDPFFETGFFGRRNRRPSREKSLGLDIGRGSMGFGMAPRGFFGGFGFGGGMFDDEDDFFSGFREAKRSHQTLFKSMMQGGGRGEGVVTGSSKMVTTTIVNGKRVTKTKTTRLHPGGKVEEVEQIRYPNGRIEEKKNSYVRPQSSRTALKHTGAQISAPEGSRKGKTAKVSSCCRLWPGSAPMPSKK